MAAVEKPEKYREGGRRAEQVGKQKKVEHAIALRRHDDYRDGQQKDQPARQPHQSTFAHLGGETAYIDGDDAGDCTDGRVRSAHDQGQAQRYKADGKPERHIGHDDAEQGDGAIALMSQSDKGQAEQPHHEYHWGSQQSSRQKASAHRARVAGRVDALPVTLMEQPSKQNGYEEG